MNSASFLPRQLFLQHCKSRLPFGNMDAQHEFAFYSSDIINAGTGCEHCSSVRKDKAGKDTILLRGWKKDKRMTVWWCSECGTSYGTQYKYKQD